MQRLVFLLLFAVFVVSCEGRRTFQDKGVIKEISADRRQTKIQHEKIPGYMEAMTMMFDVKDPKELEGLQPNDQVSFRMIVTQNDGWIERVKKIGTVEAREDVRPTEVAAGTIQSPTQLSEYIAASCLLHCSDGWSYLGRAISALLRGDPHRARHLAYYAELRAATALLAKVGVSSIDSNLATAIRTSVILGFTWGIALGLEKHHGLGDQSPELGVSSAIWHLYGTVVALLLSRVADGACIQCCAGR